MAKNSVAVRFNSRLELEMVPCGPDLGLKSIRCTLTRTQAQALANEILSLAGPSRKSLLGRSDSGLFAGELVTAKQTSTVPTVKVGTSRVVRITQQDKQAADQQRRLDARRNLPQSAWDPSCPKW